MRTFSSATELLVAPGEELGPGPWQQVDQKQIQAFADATGDHQWIHLDTERAAGGPFGSTIAHGFLTLSLLPVLSHELYALVGVKQVLNYGLNRVRFPAPLPSGASVRATGKIAEVTRVGDAVQMVMTITVHSDAGQKPCCVADSVARIYFDEEHQ